MTCFDGTGAPFGYLLCDGSAIDRERYSALFSVINVIYGSGDGTGTFNLPDLQSRIPVGRNLSQSPFTALAMTGGEITHTLTIPEMPSHLHTGTTDSAGTHTHTITDPGHSHSLPMSSAALTGVGPNDDFTQGSGYTSGSSTTGITINANGSHVHTFTSTTTGGDQPHNNLQPYIVLNYIIKY